MMHRDRLLNVIALPATTAPAVVWREIWLAGFDVPHPEPGQTLLDWLPTLPEGLLTKMARRQEYSARFTPDSATQQETAT